MHTSETAQRIIRAAEHLFAVQGFHQTTLRQITRRAGVNLAAVNYHMGSKQALIRAVFEQRLDALNRERLQRLEAALAEPPRARLEAILRALIEPALALGHHGENHFSQLLLRAFAENDTELHASLKLRYGHVMQRFAAAIQGTPGGDGPDLRHHLDFIIGALTFAMADPDAGTTRDVSDRLVRFAAAALRGLDGAMQPISTPTPEADSS